MVRRLLKWYCRSYGSYLFKIRRPLVKFIECKIIGCELCKKVLSNKKEGHQICKLGNTWICLQCFDAYK